jgi:hypothetical protein
MAEPVYGIDDFPDDDSLWRVESGMLEDGLVKVHLRRWLEDQDAWRLARYLCSPVMQREASRLYKSLQLYQINSTSLISEPDQALPCSFPFEGPTTVQGIFLRLPGSTPDSPRRWLILRIERCSAPIPFDRCKEASIIAKALPFANSARSFANNFRSYTFSQNTKDWRHGMRAHGRTPTTQISRRCGHIASADDSTSRTQGIGGLDSQIC